MSYGRLVMVESATEYLLSLTSNYSKDLGKRISRETFQIGFRIGDPTRDDGRRRIFAFISHSLS